MVLSGASNADSLTLISNGSITNEAGTKLDVTKNANLQADIITLGNHAGDAINFGNLTFSGGTVTITEASATQLAGASTASNLLSLTSLGDITEAAGASLSVTNNASFVAGANAITLTNAGPTASAASPSAEAP